MTIRLAFANIEKMDGASLLELSEALIELKDKYKFVPLLILLAETWENKDANMKYELAGYTYVGKPITRSPGATRDHGGTGAWIQDSIFPQCSTVETEKQHKDILWIQMVDRQNTTYVAVVYSRPKDDLNHGKIMTTLEHNYAELSKIGRVVITGDINARITKTTRNVTRHYGPYENRLMTMLTSTGLRPLVANTKTIRMDEHWTFVGRCGGRSINDYILVEPPALEKTTYVVHQGINLQSQHRLMTAALPYEYNEEVEGWGAQDKLKYTWDEENIKHYQSVVMERYTVSKLGSLIKQQNTPTHNAIHRTTKCIMEIISGAYEKCAIRKQSQPSKHTSTKPYDRKINDLLIRKSAVLNSMRHATKVEAKTKWREVHSIQKQIQTHTTLAWKNKHAKWWKQLGEMDDEADTGEFWQLARYLKHNSDNQFPTIMEDEEGGSYRTKPDIMKHIEEYYTDISNNDDEQAHKFYKSRGMSSEEIAAIETNAKMHARTAFRRNEQREEEDGPCDNDFTWDELGKALARLGNGRSTGKDDIPSEALKHLPDIIKEALLHLINLMWRLSITPAQWNTAITKLLHKKGGRLLIKNYRPITLLNSIFKMWETLLETRTRSVIEGQHPPNLQMGSRKQNSAAYTIMAKKCLVRMATRTNQPIITLQIDMNKAYNRVCRDVLWADLFEYGVRGRLLKAIVSSYESAKEAIKIGGMTSCIYTLLNGLRQGSVLSPVLYILYTVKLIRALKNTNTGFDNEQREKIPCLMFVDDLSTFTKNMREVVEQLKAINKYALSHKGVINMQKSAISTSGNSETLSETIKGTGTKLKVAEEYIHLGAKYKLNHERTQMSISPDVTHRMSKGRAMLSEMKVRGLGQTELHQKATLRIIDKRVITSSTYGISSLETTRIDRMALNKILADGIRLACQWDREEKENNDWIILESNILPPTAVTQMNDVAAWIRAAKGKINPVIRTLFEDDDQLHAHIIKTCSAWHLTIPTLMAVKDKELYKTMRKVYMKHIRMKEEPKELEMPCSKYELGIHLQITALERAGVHQNYSTTLMELRSILRHSHRVESKVCDYCNGQETHTTVHVISRCSFPPTKERRHQEIAKTSKLIGYYLTNLSTAQLAGVLGGPLPNELTLDERRQACEAALSIFRTSPIFYPPTTSPPVHT